MKLFSSSAIYGVLLFSLSAHADFKPFSNGAYDSAIKAGKPVVIAFHASWCPTCKKQEPILNEIVGMNGYENFVALKADYDEEKNLKKSLKVSKQSTVVVFKAGKEVGRSTGSTTKDELRKLIDVGL